MSFIEAPFWATDVARRSIAPHAVSVLVTAPIWEPITVADAKLRANLDWAVGDPRDALIAQYIAAARSQVEQDTGLALPTQTRDVSLDAVRGAVITLPAQCRPLQSVTSIKTTDTAGTLNTLNATNYVVDLASGRIGLALGGAWPTDLRPFQPWILRVVAGWTTLALLEATAPGLVHAVGLLAAHYATLGRDVVTLDQPIALPYGYEDAIAPFRAVSLA